MELRGWRRGGFVNVWLMFDELNFKRKEGKAEEKREKLSLPQEEGKGENKASFSKLSQSYNF